MKKTLIVLTLTAAVVCLVQVIAADKKLEFATTKDCMMCVKMNTTAAEKAMKEEDLNTLAKKADMLAKVAEACKKQFCKSADFAMGCDMMKASAEKTAAAAKDKKADQAKEGLMALMNSCKACHEKCRK